MDQEAQQTHCRYIPEAEALVPGLNDAYYKLRSPNHVGLYTSAGKLYNHTFFGRDAGMSAKFLNDYEPETVKETIRALVRYQGSELNPQTQEQPGRIHHEFRDFRAWKKNWYYSLLFKLFGPFWGVRNRQLLTYFSHGTTATYIRLVHKYWRSTDKAILSMKVVAKNGTETTVSASLSEAAAWILSNIDTNGLFAPMRTNRTSIPYQTFQDSITAYIWDDTRLINASKSHSFVEMQCYSIDALQAMIEIFPRSEYVSDWRHGIERMKTALLKEFWLKDDQFFSSIVAHRHGSLQKTSVANVSAGWTLNATFWHDLNGKMQQQYIEPIVRRLFSDEFLTPVGLRTRSKNYSEPLGAAVDYHGSRTVWPMFTFMVIEGLRKQGFYRLAQQLEYRMVNGCRAIDGFLEFFVVDHDGTLYEIGKSGTRLAMQMNPEQDIAFTIAPLIAIARRADKVTSTPSESWKKALEDELLGTIELVELESKAQARKCLNPQPAYASRAGTNIASMWHYLTRVAR